MLAPTADDLVFSEHANHNFSKILGQLKRHTLSIHNRFRSILEDAAFVQAVSVAYKRPLIANERCGSWYLDPRQKDGSAYFKSTDGHTGAWSFSTRRLNTHLLELVGEHDGCIIVDSTRRGKRMPDALSKTIPIWCSVLNRALFPQDICCHNLYTSLQVVSPSENSQIIACLDHFLRDFLELDIDLKELRAHIKMPLRPVWVTPESNLSSMDQIFKDFHPIICCTASRRVTGGEVSEGGYIQGSGDDTENWAFGLTPSIFWENKEILLSTPETELPDLIQQLVARPSVPSTLEATDPRYVHPTCSLQITNLAMSLSQQASAGKIKISLYPEAILPNNYTITKWEMNIFLGAHKLGSRQLRTVLPTIADFVSERIEQADLESCPETKLDIIIACTSGKDHSVGVALALLCLFYDDTGQLRQTSPASGTGIDKLFIKRRLAWIMTAMPDANPSGATLQSVNSYLMKPPN